MTRPLQRRLCTFNCMPSRPRASFIAPTASADSVAPRLSVLHFHFKGKAVSVLTGPKISLPPFLPLPFAVRDRLFPCFPFSCTSLPLFSSSSEGEHQLFSSPSAFLHFPSLCLNDGGLNSLGQRFQTNSSKDGLERKQSSKGSRYCGGSQR